MAAPAPPPRKTLAPAAHRDEPLMVGGLRVTGMPIAVDVAGSDRTATLDPAGDRPTYRDAIEAVDCDPERATALVDGEPRPAEATIIETIDRVTVLRLIRGG
jgi:sulfur carrier protein ThiS